MSRERRNGGDLLLPLAARQFDRDVRRGAYHDRASIRIGSAPDRLNKQEKLFGEHESELLQIDCAFWRHQMARLTALSCRSPLPHLKQASLAIFSINQIDECGHDRYSTVDQPNNAARILCPAVFTGPKNGFFVGLFDFLGASARNQFTQP
jgi:hypothetical protein